MEDQDADSLLILRNMFLGLEKNPQKRRILEVVDKFY